MDQINQSKMNACKTLLALHVFLFLSLGAASAQVSDDVSMEEQQMSEINESFRNAIEENQELSTRIQELEAEMERLRSESADTSQYENLKRERDELVNTVQQVRETNRKYAQEIKKLESNIQTQQAVEPQGMDSRMSARLGAESGNIVTISTSDSESASEETQEEVTAREEKTMDLLSKIDAFYEEDERLRMDAAKAHYNMGNIYYQKGEFEIAAREYYQAMTLMPDDPDSHYNLAFVSGEHLNDQQTALRHYQTYLYLKPDAQDAHLVQEKIVKAKLMLENRVESPLETQQ